MRFALAWLLFSAVAAAQSAPLHPLELPYSEVPNYRLGPHPPLRVPPAQRDPAFPWVELQLVVAPDGSVLSATPLRGKPNLLSAATAQALTWRYRSYVRNGQAIAVKLRDFLPVLPPEKKPATQAAFPVIHDWSSLNIRMQRLGCTLPCPSYSVEISGNGSVTFIGGISVAVPGRHQSQISHDALAQLLDRFRGANFLALDDEYRFKAPDLPTTILTLSFDGVNKSVTDYAGEQIGMPQAVRDLEDSIDEAARTAVWTSGNRETIPALAAEGWNFKAEDAENQRLLTSIATHGDAEAMRQLLATGISLDVTEPKLPASSGERALSSAAQRGDLEMTRLLLANPKASRWHDTLDWALYTAVLRNDSDMARLLLEHGANPNFKSGFVLLAPASVLANNTWFGLAARSDATMLVRAADAGNLAMVRDLLAAHADPNQHDRDGRGALMFAARQFAHPEERDERLKIIRLLIAAGAKVNARDKRGQTALMNCSDPQIARLLLASGADPALRDNQYQTAADVARNRGSLALADLLDNAAFIKKKK